MSELFKAHISRIVSVTDEEFAYIFSHFKMKRLKKHQFLLQEGDTVLNDHWVEKGLLKAYHTDEDGKERILQFAMEDWWISDYQALATGTQATLQIDCIEHAQLLVLSAENREKLCNELHSMANFFRKKSNAGYNALLKRILLLLNKDPKSRYEQLLQLNPSLLQRVPKTLLASYLGVSRETLSRLNPE